MTFYPDHAVIFYSNEDPEKIQAARDRGQYVMLIPPPNWLTYDHDQKKLVPKFEEAA